MIVLDKTPAIDTTAYAANDAITDKDSLTVTGQHSFLERVKITDKANQKAPLKLYVFKRDFTAANRNAAFSIAGADAADLIAELPLDSWTTPVGSAFSYASLEGLKLPLQLDEQANAYTLYYQLVTTGSPTYNNINDLVLELSFLSNGDL